jgi:drug/metabolite transporter (DMT)-like permease
VVWLIYLTIAIVLMSLNSYIVKKLVKKVNPYLVLFYQYLIAIPLVLVYSLFFQANVLSGEPLIIFLGIFYVAAIAFYYTALKE